MKEKFFSRIPNDLIRLPKCEGYKTICVRYLLDEQRGLTDYTMTSIQYLLDNCGLKARRGNDGSNREFESILQDMTIEGMLAPRFQTGFPVHNLNDNLSFEINPNYFDVVDNFTKLTYQEFEMLVRNSSQSQVTRRELLCLYLYTKSYCKMTSDGNYETGFSNSLDNVMLDLQFRNKARLINLYDMLVDMKLLAKYIVGSREKRNGVRVNIPNVYVPSLNQSNSNLTKTFKTTEDYLKQYYKVDTFYPFLEKH